MGRLGVGLTELFEMSAMDVTREGSKATMHLVTNLG